MKPKSIELSRGKCEVHFDLKKPGAKQTKQIEDEDNLEKKSFKR